MRRILLCLASALAAGCSEPGVAPAQAAPDAPPAAAATIREVAALREGCALTVRFGSYAMGIDRGSAERVVQLLTSDPAVTSLSRRRWGMEGEYTLCAETRSPAAAAALLEQIRALLPAEPRGPVEARLADGTRISAPQR